MTKKAVNAAYDIKSIVANTPHHNAIIELTDLLCHKTSTTNRQFFQPEVAYFLTLLVSSMRVNIDSPERGIIPVNTYVIALATSGFGKGHSVNIMENIVSAFRKQYATTVFPHASDISLHDLSIDQSVIKGTDENEEFDLIRGEYDRQGPAPFLFDSGTTAAVKQLRYKLQLAGVGAINFQMDEIGSNLTNNMEIVEQFLELYDLGKTKTKLIKNTNDQKRGLDLVDGVPTNSLMFGTTSKLFDGSRIESSFFSMLESGYARRCIFGLGIPDNVEYVPDAEDLYDSLISSNPTNIQNKWTKKLESFADISHYKKVLKVPRDTGIEMIKYRLECERLANKLPEHEILRKAELSHRYFKTLKLSGVFAFLDGSTNITVTHYRQAMKLVEESGICFDSLLNRERTYIRLAKYIAQSSNKHITHADLIEDLPFYPQTSNQRREMIDLATAWGLSNHTVIKREITEGVEFFSGSTLKPTNLNKLIFSCSKQFADGYVPYEKTIKDLHKLVTLDGYNWCNHAFKETHRKEDNIIEGFNLIVLDIDGDITLKNAQNLMSEYKYITYTTKRHTDDSNRFRLILFPNYYLHLNKEDYKDMMDTIIQYLPFKPDLAANQRSRKWLSNKNAKVDYHEGELFNITPYIPKTKKNSAIKAQLVDMANLGNLERWFLTRMVNNNRNNELIKYAYVLKDGGLDQNQISSKVISLNKQMANPLSSAELNATVLTSIKNHKGNP